MKEALTKLLEDFRGECIEACRTEYEVKYAVINIRAIELDVAVHQFIERHIMPLQDKVTELEYNEPQWKEDWEAGQ